MQTRVAIRLESHDCADPRRLDEARNLVSAEDDKVFARIRGNDFTFEDALAAVEIIRRTRKEIYARIDSEMVFADPAQQAVFANGVKANADQAVILAEQFLTDLRTDIALAV